jgi:1-hydroxycarotenoid 3,4-desaturase
VVRREAVVIGAGVGGLVATLLLAAAGRDVVLLERAATPGGKMRRVEAGGLGVESGPTVFTMRAVFEEIFARAGLRLEEHVRLVRADVLARHAWGPGEVLDLHTDVDRSADAIDAFAGAREAEGFRAFAARAKAIHDTLERPFMLAERPSPFGLVRAVGPANLGALFGTSPFTTLWRALGEHFRDPRLKQLFGRYATYVGSSPFLCPATLMLIAHVELAGVWMIEGGMHGFAATLAGLAAEKGAEIRYGADVAEILVEGGAAAGVVLASGERIAASHVIAAGDASALATGRFGPAVARAADAVRPAERSLSAVTWSIAGEPRGFPLLHHTVFFSDDYQTEFEAILRGRRLPADPTIYVCAEDRDDRSGEGPGGPERLLVLVNAPADGDHAPLSEEEIARCEDTTFRRLARSGLEVTRTPETTRRTTPKDFERLFPATGGAIYGRASHGWTASFKRPGARTKVPGLHLAGGSAHPGAGVPMAALSGRIAALGVMAALGSTPTSRRTAMPGGTSTR